MDDMTARKEFFAEIEALIEKYQDKILEAAMKDDEPDEDGQAIDPNSPMVLSGMALVLCFSNLDGWTIGCVESPLGQNPYFTRGLMEEFRRG